MTKGFQIHQTILTYDTQTHIGEKSKWWKEEINANLKNPSKWLLTHSHTMLIQTSRTYTNNRYAENVDDFTSSGWYGKNISKYIHKYLNRRYLWLKIIRKSSWRHFIVVTKLFTHTWNIFCCCWYTEFEWKCPHTQTK